MNYCLISPLSIPVSKSRKFILNMNNYRNIHYQSLNKAKINYKAAMAMQIKPLPELSKIIVQFTLYPKTRRLTDIPNVCSIHDKFLMDALTELGKIQDDNYLFHRGSKYVFGEVDKKNPRVEILIIEVLE